MASSDNNNNAASVTSEVERLDRGLEQPTPGVVFTPAARACARTTEHKQEPLLQRSVRLHAALNTSCTCNKDRRDTQRGAAWGERKGESGSRVKLVRGWEPTSPISLPHSTSRCGSGQVQRSVPSRRYPGCIIF